MKKVINGLLATALFFAGQSIVGQAGPEEVTEGRDVARLRTLLQRRSVEPGLRIQMRDADLRNTDLSGTDLTNVDFTGADLRNTDLSGANLTNTITMHARQEGANFEGAIGLFPAQKDDARRQGALNVPD